MTPEVTPAVVASAVATGTALPEAPGVTGTLVLVVTGTAAGDVKVPVRLVDGRPVGAPPADGPEPELTLTLPSVDAAAIVAGALEPSVAFMRGRLKTAGDNGLLLGVLAATAAPEFASWLAGLAAASGHP